MPRTIATAFESEQETIDSISILQINDKNKRARYTNRARVLRPRPFAALRDAKGYDTLYARDTASAAVINNSLGLAPLENPSEGVDTIEHRVLRCRIIAKGFRIKHEFAESIPRTRTHINGSTQHQCTEEVQSRTNTLLRAKNSQTATTTAMSRKANVEREIECFQRKHLIQVNTIVFSYVKGYRYWPATIRKIVNKFDVRSIWVHMWLQRIAVS